MYYQWSSLFPTEICSYALWAKIISCWICSSFYATTNNSFPIASCGTLGCKRGCGIFYTGYLGFKRFIFYLSIFFCSEIKDLLEDTPLLRSTSLSGSMWEYLSIDVNVNNIFLEIDFHISGSLGCFHLALNIEYDIWKKLVCGTNELESLVNDMRSIELMERTTLVF